MTSFVSRYLLVFAAVLGLAAVVTPPATVAAPAHGRGPLQKLFGLSRDEVENFAFSRTPIDSTMNWRIMRTDRELLKLLRQRAKFVLQNNPDSMAELNARIIIGVTDRMGIGDGPQPPNPPQPPTPPEPPAPPTPPTPPTTPPAPPAPPTPPTTPPAPPATTTLVVPADPDHSPLVLRVEGKILPGMPFGRPMTSDKVAVFRQWVRAGAQEAFYRQKVAPIVAANCLFCHSRSMPAARLSLENWDDVRSRIAHHVASR